MAWISEADVLVRLLAEARLDAARLGHAAAGWAPSGQAGVFTACCPLCWATGTITVRRLGSAASAGGLLNLRCRPEVAS